MIFELNDIWGYLTTETFTLEPENYRSKDIVKDRHLLPSGNRAKDERITLVEGDKVITEEKDVVKVFKDHFEKIVETLKIDSHILSALSDDPVLNSIKNFSHHASILKIKEARNSSDCFSFKLVTIEDICKKICALSSVPTRR